MYLIFVEDNWMVIDNFIFILGVCYDDYDVFGS